MKNLRVPLDLSEISIASVDRASCLAQSFGSKLWLLHVFSPIHNHVRYNVDQQLLRKDAAQEIVYKRQKLQQLAHHDRVTRRRGYMLISLFSALMDLVICITRYLAG